MDAINPEGLSHKILGKKLAGLAGHLLLIFPASVYVQNVYISPIAESDHPVNFLISYLIGLVGQRQNFYAFMAIVVPSLAAIKYYP